MDSKFTVVFDAKTYEVEKTSISDLVAFERQFDVPASIFSEKDASIRFEWLCFLMFRGLRRLGVIGKDVAFDDDFLERVESIDSPDIEEVPADVDPTVSAPPTGTTATTPEVPSAPEVPVAS
jgi:hypothetical protein